MVGFNFAPVGWAKCEGQILPISQNVALFSIWELLMAAMVKRLLLCLILEDECHASWTRTWLDTQKNLGENGGTSENILTVNEMPSHNHFVNAVTGDGNQSSPIGNYPGNTKVLDKEYSDAVTTTTMKSSMFGNTGGNQPINNVQPFLAVNFIISLYGIYPTPN